MKDDVENFLELCIKFSEAHKNVKAKLESYSDMVNKADKATQDLLHKLELSKLSHSEKTKLATKLSNIRKDRRYYKDKVEALSDIVDKFNSWVQFNDCVNKLGNIAGNSRKNYKNRNNRKYTPKVFTEMGIISEKENRK